MYDYRERVNQGNRNNGYYTKRGNYLMYQADEKRYEAMKYHRCGASGLMLPELSLGLWHNFGDTGVYENMKQMCFTAFDNGITHFDLANNYGPQMCIRDRSKGIY